MLLRNYFEDDTPGVRVAGLREILSASFAFNVQDPPVLYRRHDDAAAAFWPYVKVRFEMLSTRVRGSAQPFTGRRISQERRFALG